MNNIDEEIINFLKNNHPKAILLSTNIKKTYFFNIQCECGHIWKTKWRNLKIGKWCTQCSPIKKQKVTIERIQNFVKENYNGNCLSKTYKPKEKLNFVCEKNHSWKAFWYNINSGFWCPFCNCPKPTIESINLFLKNKGSCIDSKYIHVDDKLTFKCNCGNIFKDSWNNIQKGIWCRKKTCTKRHIPTIDYIKEFVWEKHQGICLDQKYIHSEHPMFFKCKNNHLVKTKWIYVKSGQWCSYCANNRKKTIIEINEILKEKYNGKCISKNYKNSKTPLIFECAQKHQWSSNWKNIKYHWCPVCSTRFGEKFTKFVFEKIFNEKFKKIRPEWLINPKTGQKLELDGYCERLKLAFEYQGNQHFKFNKCFHNNYLDFKNQQYRDDIKKQVCIEKNIELITIPQFNKEFKPKHLKSFILKNLKKDYKINNEFNCDGFWSEL